MLLAILLKIKAPLTLIFTFFSFGIGDESLPLLGDVVCRVPYFKERPAATSEFLNTQGRLLSKFRPSPLIANEAKIFTHRSTVPLPNGDLIYANSHGDCFVYYVKSTVWNLTLNPDDDAIVTRTPDGNARKIATKTIGGLKDHIFVGSSFDKEVYVLRTIKDSRHRHFVPYLTSFTCMTGPGRIPWYTIVMPYLPFSLSDVLELEDDPRSKTSMSDLQQRKVDIKKTLQSRKEEVLDRTFISIRCVVHAVCFIHHGITRRLKKCRRIYHNDLQPSNVLMNESLEAKLADFNKSSVKHHWDESNTTQNTSSPMYEPPEKADKKKVGAAYDMWGLGCVLLEMVTWVTCETSQRNMSATSYFRDYRKLFCNSAVEHQACQPNHPHREGFFKDCMPAVHNWISWLRDPSNVDNRPRIVSSNGCLPININLRLNQRFNPVLLSSTLDLIEQMMSLEPSGRPTAQDAQQQLDNMSFPTDDCCRHPFYGPPTSFHSRPRVSSFAGPRQDVPSTRRRNFASSTLSPPFPPRSLQDVSIPVPSVPDLKRWHDSTTNGAEPSLKRFRVSQGEENCNAPKRIVPSRIPHPARISRSPLADTHFTSGSSSSTSYINPLQRANNIPPGAGGYRTH